MPGGRRGVQRNQRPQKIIILESDGRATISRTNRTDDNNSNSNDNNNNNNTVSEEKNAIRRRGRWFGGVKANAAAAESRQRGDGRSCLGGRPRLRPRSHKIRYSITVLVIFSIRCFSVGLFRRYGYLTVHRTQHSVFSIIRVSYAHQDA